MGTSAQISQFEPTEEEENWLKRLRMAKEIQCIIPYVHDNNVTRIHSTTLQLYNTTTEV